MIVNFNQASHTEGLWHCDDGFPPERPDAAKITVLSIQHPSHMVTCVYFTLPGHIETHVNVTLPHHMATHVYFTLPDHIETHVHVTLPHCMATHVNFTFSYHLATCIIVTPLPHGDTCQYHTPLSHGDTCQYHTPLQCVASGGEQGDVRYVHKSGQYGIFSIGVLLSVFWEGQCIPLLPVDVK